jgi:hypothetical protein
MPTARREFGPAQEKEIVRRHLAGRELVSDLADEQQAQPGQIHAELMEENVQAKKATGEP